MRVVTFDSARASGRIPDDREVVMALILLVARGGADVDRLSIRRDLYTGGPVRVACARVVDVVPELVAGRIEFHGDNGPEQVTIISVPGQVDVPGGVGYELVTDLLEGLEIVVSRRDPGSLPNECSGGGEL